MLGIELGETRLMGSLEIKIKLFVLDHYVRTICTECRTKTYIVFKFLIVLIMKRQDLPLCKAM
jgi:hypothetical protein